MCVCASKTSPTDSAASRVCVRSVRETAIAIVKIPGGYESTCHMSDLFMMHMLGATGPSKTGTWVHVLVLLLCAFCLTANNDP